MEAILTNIVAAVNDVLWNKYLVLLFLLLGSGIYFTIPVPALSRFASLVRVCVWSSAISASRVRRPVRTA